MKTFRLPDANSYILPGTSCVGPSLYRSHYVFLIPVLCLSLFSLPPPQSLGTTAYHSNAISMNAHTNLGTLPVRCERVRGGGGVEIQQSVRDEILVNEAYFTHNRSSLYYPSYSVSVYFEKCKFFFTT